MSRIEKLTFEQENLIPFYRDKWVRIGLSTDPADRKQAEYGIIESYRSAGLKPPKKIVWCGSPLSQGLTRAIILNDKLKASVGASVWASVGASVWASVGASVGDSVRASVWDSVGDSVWDSVRDSMGASVWDSVWDSVGDSVVASIYGQHDASWLAFYEYFNRAVKLKHQTQKLTGLWLLSKSAGWALPHEHICWVSERHHILNRDENGRLHSLSGPAAMYPDGWSIYAVHGVRLPSWIIENPEKITVKSIDKESNVEIKRVMIDRYGQDRFLLDSGAKQIHQDPCGTLYQKQIPNDEPLTMIKVINASMESDGSRKEYFLRVPPDIKTAQEAVAWTFGMNSEQYSPAIES